MSMGSGSSGSSGDSTAFLREQQAEANRKERERKLRINKNIAAINDIFKGTSYAPTVKYENKLTYDPNWKRPEWQPEKPNDFFYTAEGKLKPNLGTYDVVTIGQKAVFPNGYGGKDPAGYVLDSLGNRYGFKVDENGMVTEGGLKLDYTPPPAPKLEEGELTTVDPELWVGKTDPKREAMFKSVHDDTMNYHLPDLKLKRDVAARENKFELARRGLTAGSVDAWTAGERDRLYQKGVQDVTGVAMNAEHQARTADEQSRLSLIARASSDEANSSLISDALNSLGQSAAVGKAQVQAQQIVDPFVAAANLFSNTATTMGAQAALQKMLNSGANPTKPVGFANTGGNVGNNGNLYPV